ncbi:MAG: serine hydrolase [Thermoprotei archaeon]|nr:MAG: serine hydrolase [Thermoprotei archaeon]
MTWDPSRLEGFILEKMSETKIPGLSIAIVKDNEIVYSRGFGFRDITSGMPATPKTIYGIGSVTKSFTALSVMQLVEEGKLSLDDPIEKYVPLRIRPLGSKITIHHLLTHTSGIPALAYAEAFIHGIVERGRSWLPVAKPEDIITFMREAEDWVVTQPGKRFFYLNEGYVLLGYIISKVSGMKYEDYIKKKILEPLDMCRTYFHKQDVDRDPDVATPYVFSEKEGHIPSRFPYGITSDGGLLSNVVDLSKYLIMYINRGEYNGRRVADKKSIELMEKPYIKVPYEIFGDEAYGYGLMIYPNFLGEKLIGHGGSVLVYTAYVGYIPERRIGVAVLANSSGYSLSNIGMYALALMLGKNPDELPFIHRENVLRKLEGDYETYKGTMRVQIKRQGDFLFMEMKGRYVKWQIPLVFEREEDDVVVFYTLSRGSKIYAEFYLKKDKVELIYERYKFVKVS